jgi:uncharacterized RDD family membrane protein YckC
VDKLTIDTPEQVPLEFVLAGIGSRFMAVFLDTLIQGVVLFVIGVAGCVLTASAASLGGKGASVWIVAVTVFVLWIVYVGYYSLFEIFWKGQTPGKRWAGIRVIKDSGRPINTFEAITRNLVRIVDFMPSFYGVGVITMFLNAKHRRLGDFVAGTLVVHESSDRASALFFNTPEKTEFSFPEAVNLSPQEADLIETFLARRLEIPPETRRQSSLRIAEMISNRLGIPPEARAIDVENFLELVLKEFRNRARYR